MPLSAPALAPNSSCCTGEESGRFETLDKTAPKDRKLSPHQLAFIRREKLLELMARHPKFALNLVRNVTDKLVLASRDIQALSFLDAQQRVARALLDLAVEHGKKTLSDQYLVKLRFVVTHERISKLIAANRPHVSTIMSDFKKRGWIKYRGRKLLINISELQHRLDQVPQKAAV